MSIYPNNKSYNNRFYKTLNQDIQLKKQENGKYDLSMENDDYLTVSGLESLYNACIIACLTGYNEIGSRFNNETYTDFGNHAFELLKENKSQLLIYKLEEYFKKVLSNIRRVRTVNEVIISQEDTYSFNVYFNVTSLDDLSLYGNIVLGDSGKLINTNIYIETDSHIIHESTGNLLKCVLMDSRKRPIPYQIVNLFNGDELLSVGLTNLSGEYVFNYSPISSTIKSDFIVKYDGDSDYNKSKSNILSLLIILYNFNLSHGSLFYNYDLDNYHPNFIIDSEGCLICTYDNSFIEDFYINEEGNLIVTIK
jgi:hypothetical protein